MHLGVPTDRKSFLAGSMMLCLTGGAIPHTKKLVAVADAHARAATAMPMASPRSRSHGAPAHRDPVDSLTFGTPQPMGSLSRFFKPSSRAQSRAKAPSWRIK